LRYFETYGLTLDWPAFLDDFPAQLTDRRFSGDVLQSEWTRRANARSFVIALLTSPLP